MRWIKGLGVTAALCALLSVVGCGGDDPEMRAELSVRATTSTTASTSTTSTTLAPPDDGEIARAAVLTSADLPAGTQAGPTSVWSGADLDTHICGSPDGLPPHTAGFDAQFIVAGPAGGQDGFHLAHGVFLAPTVPDAEAEFAAVDSAGYQDCAFESVGRASSRGGAVVSSEVARGAVPGGLPGIVDRFTTTFGPGQACDCEVAYTTFVRMQVGRAIVRMPVLRFDRHLTDEELQPLVDRAHALAVEAQGST